MTLSREKKQILEAAQQLFMQFGFSKTTMKDIAVRAGLSRATVYNLFEDKKSLQRAYIAYALEQVKPRFDEIVDSSESVKTRLQQCAAKQVTLFAEWFGMFPHRMEEYLAAYKESIQMREAVFAYYKALFAKLLSEEPGMAEDPEKVEALSRALVTLVRGFEIEYVTRDDFRGVLDEMSRIIEGVASAQNHAGAYLKENHTFT